jgi:hypothetical protein
MSPPIAPRIFKATSSQPLEQYRPHGIPSSDRSVRSTVLALIAAFLALFAASNASSAAPAPARVIARFIAVSSAESRAAPPRPPAVAVASCMPSSGIPVPSIRSRLFFQFSARPSCSPAFVAPFRGRGVSFQEKTDQFHGNQELQELPCDVAATAACMTTSSSSAARSKAWLIPLIGPEPLGVWYSNSDSGAAWVSAWLHQAEMTDHADSKAAQALITASSRGESCRAADFDSERSSRVRSCCSAATPRARMVSSDWYLWRPGGLR